ncbi:germination-specific N-acetylmuramoyl-L-alanine amidase precursor [Clostridium homopropionicum DSM 5847]|uniref:Germination-specific N-acetylmuramoyl-L-alanine amidase n=1 Tax=Clostridium homopropionicum DSM 5847 TaxID=1121318 RepID=A0A0L6ZA65_9CLOT|nr:germination-specific N-acetylmuramoyl-L-alanine amidase precursor [Clostridium homopropionicum DSM 5847]SFF75784.1 N-acetylmuramoyl-L-alanine amidase [Clostridium homopropionicum]
MYKIKIYKIKIFIISVLILICPLIYFSQIPVKAFSKIAENEKKIILIDAGHGGIDGGAVSKRGTVEKDINLKISLFLKEVLEAKDFKVLMIRDSDIGLYSENGRIRDKKNEDLNNRCKFKEESKCDVFISIHLNMFPQSQYYGAQVWYSKEGKSADLANIIQNNLINDLDKTNTRKEKCAKGAYKVLRCSEDIPSVLIECGFLSNPREEEKLKTEAYQREIAKSIGKSISEYFVKYNKQNEDNTE